ncbi:MULTISPECIES: cytochrome c biogenesis CcdA family protein [Bacillaceae]|uniref:cytochrome c biogenesis CcdA family protein n=1 Tax=Bacillaceae TaxID=186817 RepID=UPI0018DCD35F|nr:cytochrome c biogenesis protein CcdA [Rossellomorea sp. YZS02]MBH9965653.1 sulfite exporter TauE/SafE family protein [[Bacillus] enclensis]MBW3111149.1 cytochrome c biogenesis protein CcdA [Bacillus sp. MCCB 382]MDX8345173.1 cytochrome c biogenesis protein CcdA [Rossellomorea sp. YZS02]
MQELNILFAFGAGLLSFLSPCTLPIYPAFLSYITGMSIDELNSRKGMQRKAILHTVFFLIGFSIIFIFLGVSGSFIGNFFLLNKELLRQIGAIFVVFFGLVVSGLLKFDFLMKDKRIQFKRRPSGYLGTMLIGIGFAAGWTPCTGPILAAVISLGITDPNAGLFFMAWYILGFAVPFFVLSFFLGKAKWINKYSSKIMKIGGYLMIFMGIILYFNWMNPIISFLTNYLFGGFTGF